MSTPSTDKNATARWADVNKFPYFQEIKDEILSTTTNKPAQRLAIARLKSLCERRGWLWRIELKAILRAS
jgi:hypothetical protein